MKHAAIRVSVSQFICEFECYPCNYRHHKRAINLMCCWMDLFTHTPTVSHSWNSERNKWQKETLFTLQEWDQCEWFVHNTFFRIRKENLYFPVDTKVMFFLIFRFDEYSFRKFGWFFPSFFAWRPNIYRNWSTFRSTFEIVEIVKMAFNWKLFISCVKLPLKQIDQINKRINDFEMPTKLKSFGPVLWNINAERCDTAWIWLRWIFCSAFLNYLNYISPINLEANFVISTKNCNKMTQHNRHYEYNHFNDIAY